jgi:transposase
MLKQKEEGLMERLTAIGIDLAKRVFQVHGVNLEGKVSVKRKLSRSGLLKFVGNLEPCLIGVEASGGCRYWVREFKKFGHDVRIMAPQFVKPYVKSDKNDANDAAAICEAVQRPDMRFVAEKSMEQQEIQMLHRIRSGLVSQRTELCNELRAILSDYGIVTRQGLQGLQEKLNEVLSSDNELSGLAKEILTSLLTLWTQGDEHVERIEKQLDQIFDKYEVCRRLETIPGVGRITATAILGTVPNASEFKTGRHLSAWLGLVPRQNSSGGKQRLSGITKRGDTYLRTLLIHGGRTVVQHATKKQDKRSLWIANKAKTRGRNKAAVAVANKNARVIWKILKTNEVYRVA